MFVHFADQLSVKSRFSRLTCINRYDAVFVHVVNVGTVTGLLPVVGAPLPLISMGTAMLTVF